MSRLVRAVCVVSVAMGIALAASPARAAIDAADRKMIEEVFARLASQAERPQDMPAWPPDLGFYEQDEFNAFATFQEVEGKSVPVVRVYSLLIQKSLHGSADRSAMVLGHEIGHHVLGHTRRSHDNTPLLETTFTRAQEYAADLYGMQLLLKAGYSFKGAVALWRQWDESGLGYSSFEAIASDHPAPVDRAAQLDKEQAQLWTAMGAFESGVYFLTTQQYALAERSFRAVTKEFPDAGDAWANLGYAQLMQYADALETDDLRKLDLGQIVIGGFYRRPTALAARVRGVNEEMWTAAVGALREALRHDGKLSLAKANLGVAYMIAPTGKDPAKAIPLLEEARALADKDPGLDPVSRLALATNLAVAYGAGGKDAEFRAALDAVAAAIEAAPERERAGYAQVSSAIEYSRAFASAGANETGQRQQGLVQLEQYLRGSSPASAWWTLAYDRYSTLCGSLNETPKARATLSSRAPSTLRQVASVETQKMIVALGDKLAAVQKALGPGTVAPVVPGTSLVRVSYVDRGLELLATDEVLAIQFVSENAPALPLRSEALSSAKKELKVGMTVDDLDAALGDLAQSFDYRPIADPNVKYRFYSDIGVAVRVQKGHVVEIALAMIPKARVL